MTEKIDFNYTTSLDKKATHTLAYNFLEELYVANSNSRVEGLLRL